MLSSLLSRWIRLRATRKIGFRTALLQLVLGALLLSVTLIGVLGYVSSARTLDDLREKHAALVSLAMSQEADRLLGTADTVLPELKTMALRGVIDLKDFSKLGVALGEILRSQEDLSWLSYSEARTGRFIGAGRTEDGSVVINQSDPQVDNGRRSEYLLHVDGSRTSSGRLATPGYDPRTREWYKNAVAAHGRVVWSEPYEFQEGTPGLTASMSVEPDSPTGVFTADFSVQDVTTYLSRLIQSHKLLVFLSTISGKPFAIASGIDVPSPVAYAACEQAISRGVSILADGQPKGYTLRLENEPYSLTAAPHWLSDGFGFITGVLGSENEFIGSARRNLLLTAVIGFLAIATAAIAAIWLSGLLAEPLKNLSRDLELVSKFELSNAQNPASAFHEIAVIIDSSERMKSALRSFGKYVPIEVVRELLAEKQDAIRGGNLRELTLFFSDIANFTKISETLSPAEVVKELGDYFELITDIIENDFRGTLDKFVGDGVVAFFGAPRHMSNHAEMACRAALKIQEKLFSSQPEKGLPGGRFFRTRIGLHTGEVLVGNIGTPKRFAYSVIGDAANLTSRIEGLNKLYGTRILASAETKNSQCADFEWRCVDRVAVVGRTQSTEIYELLGTKGAVDRILLEARDQYENALEKYFAQDFEGAIPLFEAALKLRPTDKVCELLRVRCQNLVANPRPSDWSGVYEAAEK
ncbi:MAG TPA: adenylate/guanylate cyclase domain-containing protein [Chthoniobacterales bacterium]|nr:adenylate/guanylate cyclase domain-containing protein [Chthoniobacterales bacterium]